VTGTEFGADGTVYASFEDGTRLDAAAAVLVGEADLDVAGIDADLVDVAGARLEVSRTARGWPPSRCRSPP
jgi:hypothetical protein